VDHYPDIKNYLVLPIDDEKPPFREKYDRPFVQEVIMLAILNGILITVFLTLFWKIPTYGLKTQIIIFIMAFIVQLFMFFWICKIRERDYKKKFPSMGEQE